jgi:hypothetical protein
MERYTRKEVKLDTDRREYLMKLLSTSPLNSQERKRIEVLLLLGRGIHTEPEVAHLAQVSISQVKLLKKRYALYDGHLHDVVFRKRRTDNQKRVLTPFVEQTIFQLVLSPPPPPASKWSSRLIAKELVKGDIVDSISHMSIARLLRNKLTPSLGGE